MAHHPRPSRRHLLAAGCAVLVLGLAASACVTTVETIDPFGLGLEQGNPLADQGPVIIPIGEAGAPAGGGMLDEYYRSVLFQMREAYLAEDLPALRSLLEVHDRESAPDWARPSLARLRRLALGMGFGEWLAETSKVVLLPARPEDGALEGDGGRVPLGAPVRLRVHLGTAPVPEDFASVVLRGAGSDQPTRFRAVFVIADTNARGDRGIIGKKMMVELPETHRFAAGPAVLPIEFELDAGDAVIRDLRVTVELLAGFLEFEGNDEGLPRHGVRLAEDRFSLYPARVGQVERAPLEVLERALELQDARFHGHVLLATRFLDEAQRRKAVAPLVDWVRFGTGAEPDVAMAALTTITGEGHGRDREGWLRWFQANAALYR